MELQVHVWKMGIFQWVMLLSQYLANFVCLNMNCIVFLVFLLKRVYACPSIMMSFASSTTHNAQLDHRLHLYFSIELSESQEFRTLIGYYRVISSYQYKSRDSICFPKELILSRLHLFLWHSILALFLQVLPPSDECFPLSIAKSWMLLLIL